MKISFYELKYSHIDSGTIPYFSMCHFPFFGRKFTQSCFIHVSLMFKTVVVSSTHSIYNLYYTFSSSTIRLHWKSLIVETRAYIFILLERWVLDLPIAFQVSITLLIKNRMLKFDGLLDTLSRVAPLRNSSYIKLSTQFTVYS